VPVGTIRVLKIIPDYLNQPPDDFLLVSLTPKPLYVPVPTALVPEGVLAIRTEPIDLKDITSSFVAETKLVYPFELPEGTGLPTSCEVSVEVSALEVQGPSAARIEVTLAGADPRYEYVLTPPQLKVLSDALAGMSREARARARDGVIASLQVRGLPPGEHHLVPQIILPPELDHVRIIPNFLTLSIIERGE
jgi:hypothetical protein